MKQIQVEPLRHYCESVLRRCGVAHKDASIVADCLLYANLSGVDSHGIIRLPHYVQKLTNGTTKTAPSIRFDQPASTVLRVDGDDGLGHVITKRAVERAVPICRQNGSVTIAIRNSSHFGMAGYYVRDITAEGMIGMVTTHTDARIVPHGARTPFAGTNPIAFGFPTRGEPFLLDFATTKVSFGKVALARTEGHSIPDDWGVDENGEPTTDPNSLVGMNAIAEYKGSGLAMIIDLFCAMLTGMPYGTHINRMYEEVGAPRKLGHFVTMWDADAFVGTDALRGRMETYINDLHQLPRNDPRQPILFPGEKEAQERATRIRNGIPIEAGLRAQLAELGTGLGIEIDFLR